MTRLASIDGIILMALGVVILFYNFAAPTGPLVGYAYPSTISPQQLQKAYGLDSLINSSHCNAGPCDGSGQTVAVFEKGDFNLSDVLDFSWRWGLSPLNLTVSRWSTTSHRFEVTPPEFERTLGNGEAVMDIDAIHSVASGAAIHVYVVFQNTPDPLGSFLDAVLSAPSSERTVSISYATCENQGKDAALQQLDLKLQALAQHGDSVFAGSGDDGKYCPVGRTTTGANFPASSPYVTAVGGTSLLGGIDGSYQRETAWDNGRQSSSGATGATGGGSSHLFARPSWQMPIQQSGAYRVIPDVAAVADATSNSLAIEDTQHFWERLLVMWSMAGGTSLSTPIWAGFAAVYNEYAKTHGGEPLGFANPAIYYLGSQPHQLAANPLRDVTLNGSRTADLAAPARMDWDLATGWGSFNAAAFIHDRLDQGISVRVNTVGQSADVVAVATGFPPGETVDFVVNPERTSCSARTDDSGQAECHLVIAQKGLLGGQLVFEAFDNQAGMSARTTITGAAI